MNDRKEIENPLISIIIPMINSACTIGRCLQSLINQSYNNIQIIIVDDYSSDNSVSIAQKMTKNHYNSIIIETNGNNGAGGCRNIGLENASGKYIGFIDSDDWIDTMMYEKLIKIIERTNSEIAICGVLNEYDNPQLAQIRYKYDLENVIDGEFALKLLSRSVNQDISISPVVWNKIYLADFLFKKDLKFLVNSYNEDDAFIFCCFLHSHRIVLTPNTYYHYYQRENSNTHFFSKKHIIDLINSFASIKSYLIKYNLYEQNQSNYYSFFEKCLAFILNNLATHEKSKEIQIKYLQLLFSELNRIFDTQEYINHVGLQRIYDFIAPYRMK